MTVKTKRAASGRIQTSASKSRRSSTQSKSVAAKSAAAVDSVRKPTTRRTRSKVMQRAKVKRRAGTHVGTVGEAALKVAKSGARLATYSAKFALAKVEGVWQSAIHSVAERNSKSSSKSR